MFNNKLRTLWEIGFFESSFDLNNTCNNNMCILEKQKKIPIWTLSRTATVYTR